MPRESYSTIVPESKTRTALSGMLGREFWDIASETIWPAVENHMSELGFVIAHHYLTDDCCGVLYWSADGKILCNECGMEFDIVPKNK